MLFGDPLINTRACFHENSQRSLVNLSEIISKAGGVKDCGSGGKENQVGLAITSHYQFSISLVTKLPAVRKPTQ